MANWYVSSTGWTAVAPWAASTAYAVGALVRQLATPTVGNERVWRCTTAGTSAASEPAWTLTKSSTTTSGTAVFTEVTGQETYQAPGAWGAPHARLASAFGTSWAAAGDNVYLSHDHAETQATALTIAPTGTSASPNYIACVTSAGSVPPVSADLRTTATISTTTSATLQISGAHATVYGIIFSCGTGANTQAFTIGSGTGHLTFDSCALRRGATGGTSAGFSIGGTNSGASQNRIVLQNTTLQFGSTGDKIALYSSVRWRSTAGAITGATLPSALLGTSGAMGEMAAEGVDLSAIPAGSTIVDAACTARSVALKDCKFAAGVTVAATPNAPSGCTTHVLRSDSAATNYRDEKYTYAGTQVPETIIVRTGGASNGTTAVSVNLTSTANSKWVLPFEGLPFVAWNASTSVATATVEGIWNAAALPTNAEVWFDLEYLGSSATPVGSFVSGTKADNLAAGTSLTASTAAWDSLVTARANSTAYTVGAVRKVASNTGRVFFCTTAGTSSASEPAGYASAVDGGSVTDGTAVFRAGVRFKQSIAFTAAQAGAVYAYPKLARASTTVYLDPTLTLA